MYYAGYCYHVSLLSQFECVDIDRMYMLYYSFNLVYVPRWFAVDIAYVVIDPPSTMIYYVFGLYAIMNHDVSSMSLTHFSIGD